MEGSDEKMVGRLLTSAQRAPKKKTLAVRSLEEVAARVVAVLLARTLRAPH